MTRRELKLLMQRLKNNLFSDNQLVRVITADGMEEVMTGSKFAYLDANSYEKFQYIKR